MVNIMKEAYEKARILKIFSEEEKRAYKDKVANVLRNAPYIESKVHRDYFEQYIMEDAKYLLKRDCFFFLYGLDDYLEKQEKHLNTIYSVSREFADSDDLKNILSFIIEVAMLDMKETIILSKELARQNCYRGSHADLGGTHSDLAEHIWKVVEKLDPLKKSVFYKEDYLKTREELKAYCDANRIDTRSKKVKRQEKINTEVRESGGCIFILVFFVVCMILGAILK